MTQLIGVFRLGKDAEVRDARDQTVANLALAYNFGKRDQGGNRPTQWVEAALWGKRAEALEEYLVKGQSVFCVLNEVHIETYEKRDGGTGSKLVATVADIELVGGRPQQAGGGERRERREPEEPQRRRAAAPAPAPRQQQGGGFDDMDDDIPF